MLTEFWSHKGWIALIPLTLAALALFAWIAIGADARTMSRDGIETEATIIDTRQITRPASTNGTVRLSHDYFVTVMFTIGSAMDNTLQIQQVEHFVDKDYFDAANEGGRVWVRYLPEDPSRIELVRGGTQSNSNAAGWVALGMLAIAALLGWLIWAQAAKVHRFKTTSTQEQATITDVTLNEGWTVLSLTLADGRTVKALPLKAQTGTYAPGGTLTVLTEPRNATQVMILAPP